MSDSKNIEVRTGGVSFASLLTVLFIGLKLTNQIDWSWWWVLSPLWIPAAIILAILVACLVVAGILWLFIAFLNLFEKKEEPKPRNKYRGL